MQAQNLGERRRARELHGQTAEGRTLLSKARPRRADEGELSEPHDFYQGRPHSHANSARELYLGVMSLGVVRDTAVLTRASVPRWCAVERRNVSVYLT